MPAYGVLVWLIARAAGLSRLWHLALAAVASAAFGGLLECAQAAIPGRFGSLEDVLLNALGAAAAVPVLLGLGWLGGRKKEQAAHDGAPAADPGNLP